MPVFYRTGILNLIIFYLLNLRLNDLRLGAYLFLFGIKFPLGCGCSVMPSTVFMARVVLISLSMVLTLYFCSGATKEMALPDKPALPVRPMR